MTNIAMIAVQKIKALRKYALPQAAMAEKRILKSLSVTDFTAVINALESPELRGDVSVTRD